MIIICSFFIIMNINFAGVYYFSNSFLHFRQTYITDPKITALHVPRKTNNFQDWDNCKLSSTYQSTTYANSKVVSLPDLLTLSIWLFHGQGQLSTGEGFMLLALDSGTPGKRLVYKVFGFQISATKLAFPGLCFVRRLFLCLL